MKKFFYILTIIIGSIVTSCKSSDQKFVEDMYSDLDVLDHKFEETDGISSSYWKIDINGDPVELQLMSDGSNAKFIIFPIKGDLYYVLENGVISDFLYKLQLTGTNVLKAKMNNSYPIGKEINFWNYDTIIACHKVNKAITPWCISLDGGNNKGDYYLNLFTSYSFDDDAFSGRIIKHSEHLTLYRFDIVLLADVIKCMLYETGLMTDLVPMASILTDEGVDIEKVFS